MTLAMQLASERRARLAAERLLAQKLGELDDAQGKLSQYARRFSAEIKQTRARVESYRDENARVKTDLVDATQKAQAIEQRLWHAVTSLDDGFAIYDRNDRLVMANATFHSYFQGFAWIQPGTTVAEVVRIAAETGMVNFGDETPATWQRSMLEQRNSPDANRIINLCDGRFIRVIDRRCPSGDLVSLFLDITESVETEKILRNAQEQAEAASRAKSAFLANMSHELRTPMNGVVGMVDLLAETKLTDEQAMFVDTIRGSGQTLLALINDVLDYSKIEADQLEIRAEPFDLEQCIHEVLRLLQPEAQKKELALLVDYDLFLPTNYLGDALRLRQVFTNLVGNAVKFTETGHVLVQVVGTFDTGTGRAQIHASIQDTGIGIPPEHLDQVFSRFHQVEGDASRSFEGTGLGLAISKRLVEKLGGEIWVESSLGQGSSFGVKIEMDLDPDCEICSPKLPDDIGHVLVIDDHETNRALLEKRVSKLGAKTSSCAYMEDSIPQAQTADLVLAHHALPKNDGLALAQALRDSGHRVPIVVFSAANALSSDTADLAGVRGRLGNPFTNKELVQTLAASPPLEHVAQDAKLAVLAVDDNRTNRLVLEKMLNADWLELSFATNGQEAVDAYTRRTPDVVLMDISMPVMDGREATRRIRAIQQDRGAKVQIIALTAHASGDIQESLLADGLDAVMTKPINKEELLVHLRALMPQQPAES